MIARHRPPRSFRVGEPTILGHEGELELETISGSSASVVHLTLPELLMLAVRIRELLGGMHWPERMTTVSCTATSGDEESATIRLYYANCTCGAVSPPFQDRDEAWGRLFTHILREAAAAGVPGSDAWESPV